MKRGRFEKKNGKALLIFSSIAILLLVAVIIISQQSEFFRKTIFQPDSAQSEEKDVLRYLDTPPTPGFLQFVEEERQAVLDDINRLQRS